MKKTPKPTLWLALTAAIALVGAGGMYMQYGSYSDLGSEEVKLRRLARRPYQVEEELSKIMGDVQVAQQQLIHLEKAVPAFAYVPTLLKELESFGRQHGLEIFGVRPMPKQEAKDKKGAKKKKEPYVELVIEVKGRGSYDAVSSFVHGLQTFPKIVAARAVSLQPKNESNVSTDILDMTIELKTYLFRPSQEELEQLAEDFKKSVEGGGQEHKGQAGAVGAEGNDPHPTASTERPPKIVPHGGM